MLSKCRICLVESGSHSVATKVLEELYEKLTATPFQAADGRPLKICYICLARLQNCYRLQTSCLQSEKLFTELLGNDNKAPTPILDKNTIKIVHPVTCTTWPPVTPEMSYEHPNPDPLGVIDINIRVKEEILEDAEDDTADTLEYTGLEDIVKPEDDVSSYNTRTNEAGYNSPSKSAELNVELDIKPEHIIQSMESQDDLQSDHNTASTEFSDATSNKQVRIVSNKIDVDTSGTRAAKKLKAGLVKEITQSTAQRETSNQQFSYKVQTMDKTLVGKTVLYDPSLLNKRVASGHKGKKRYSCEKCKKCFTLKDTLTRHTRVHIGEKPYSCEICKKGFNRKSELNYHIPQHTVPKLYSCDICKKYFKSKDTLNSHIRLHRNGKRYSCETCKKCFSRNSDLTTHIRVHTGEKPYGCDICKNYFSQKTSLIAHIRVHTDEKPYSCDICKRPFSRKSNLTTHIRRCRLKN